MGTYTQMSELARTTINDLKLAHRRVMIARWVMMQLTIWTGQMLEYNEGQVALSPDLQAREETLAEWLKAVIEGRELELVDDLPEELRNLG
jgi:hypothetical protein